MPEGSDAEANTEAEPATLVAAILGGASGLRRGLGAIFTLLQPPSTWPHCCRLPPGGRQAGLGIGGGKEDSSEETRGLLGPCAFRAVAWKVLQSVPGVPEGVHEGAAAARKVLPPGKGLWAPRVKSWH